MHPDQGQLVVLSAGLGPILVPQLSRSDAKIATGLFATQAALQDENSVPVQLLQQSYILKYLLNSQFVAALMLIDQKVPILYYLTQQVLASTVYLYLPPYVSAETSYAQPTLPFRIRIDPRRFPHQVPSQPLFRRFRMSNNFLLNNFQYLLMCGVLAFLQALVFALYARADCAQVRPISFHLRSRRLLVFLQNCKYSTFESSFLLIAVSLLLQFQSANFESALNGVSFCLALAVLVLGLWEISRTFRRINSPRLQRTEYADLARYYDQLLYDLRYAEFARETRNQTKFHRFRRFCQINFHIISYVKKFLVALVLVYLYEVPLAQLVVILFVTIASAAITLIALPFACRLLNVVRVLIELLAIAIVAMHFVFYLQE